MTQIWQTPHSKEIPIDLSDCDIEAKTLESAIREFCLRVGVSASPGFTFGDSGVIVPGQYLLCDTVPSNKAGRPVFLYDATLVAVFSMRERFTDGHDLIIEEHEGLGSTYTTVHTTTIPVGTVNADRINFDILTTPAPLTTGKGLSIKVGVNSSKNLTAGLLIAGNLVP